MQSRLLRLALVVNLMLLLPLGCGTTSGGTRQLLVWHACSAEDAEAIQELLTKFERANPGVRVVSSGKSSATILNDYVARADKGLGPDLILLPSQWAPQLADQGLIRDLSPFEINASNYLSAALDTVRYGDGLYGIPFQVHTFALYYNASLVEKPPQTLEQLADQAANGLSVFIPTTFRDAYWGIPAFGGKLLDDEGRIILHEGGFANWLAWLKQSLNAPGIILSSDYETGLSLFTEGRVAYFVGSSRDATRLGASFEEDVVRVAVLPSGPVGSAGPLLETEALMVNASSSDEHAELAMSLAQFLTNVEQQGKLARLVGHVPVNSRVRIDARITPNVAVFVSQTKTAVSLSGLPQLLDVVSMGDEAYIQALEGLTSVADAALALTSKVNSKYGYVTANVTVTCEREGSITIWHPFGGDDASALRLVGSRFMNLCPGVVIAVKVIPAEEFLKAYSQAVDQHKGPDLIIVPHTWLPSLAQSGYVRSLSDEVPPEGLQRYLTDTGGAFALDGDLYGLPVMIDLAALFYKPGLVEEPARVIDDLIDQAGPQSIVAIPIGFEESAWGAFAYGAIAFGKDGSVSLDAARLADWLSWLQVGQAKSGIVMSSDDVFLAEVFASQNAAYYVGQSSDISALGDNDVASVALPAGPAGEARSFATVYGTVMNPFLSPAEAGLALAVADYYSSEQGQSILISVARRVPVHVNVATETDPAIHGFADQARSIVLLPSGDNYEALVELGDQLYSRVLAGGDVQALASAFITDAVGLGIATVAGG